MGFGVSVGVGSGGNSNLLELWASGESYPRNQHIVNSLGDEYVSSEAHLSTAATQPGIGEDSATVWVGPLIRGLTAAQQTAMDEATTLGAGYPPAVVNTDLIPWTTFVPVFTPELPANFTVQIAKVAKRYDTILLRLHLSCADGNDEVPEFVITVPYTIGMILNSYTVQLIGTLATGSFDINPGIFTFALPSTTDLLVIGGIPYPLGEQGIFSVWAEFTIVEA